MSPKSRSPRPGKRSRANKYVPPVELDEFPPLGPISEGAAAGLFRKNTEASANTSVDKENDVLARAIRKRIAERQAARVPALTEEIRKLQAVGAIEGLRRMRSLTQKEVAAELDCSVRTIRYMVKNKRLNKSKTGRIVIDHKFAEQLKLKRLPV